MKISARKSIALLVSMAICAMLLQLTAFAAAPATVLGGGCTLAAGTAGAPEPLVITLKNPGDLSIGFIRVDIPETAPNDWVFDEAMLPQVNPGNTGAKFGEAEWLIPKKAFRFPLLNPNTAAGSVTVTFPAGIFTGSTAGSYALVVRTHDGVSMYDTPSKDPLVIKAPVAAPAPTKPTPTEPVPAVPPASEIRVYIDNQLLQLTDPLVIQEARTLVPMRNFFEALGAIVDWDTETQTAVGTRGGVVVRIPIGSTTPTINDVTHTISVPAQIINSRTYVPLRFVGEALGDDVHWDGAEQTINISRTAVVPSEKDVSPNGDPTLEWVTPVAQGTRVEHRTFDSEAVQAKVSYHIYKPEIYHEDPERSFPVLYYLHGGTPGPAIAGIPQLVDLFDAAIREEKIPPMLIVFPNSPVRYSGDVIVFTMWVDSKDGKSPVETMLIDELVPHIDANYRTIASREGRLIEGFSMGGYGAARLGFKYHTMFGAISILGAGPMQAELLETPRVDANVREALLQETYGGGQAYFIEVSPRRMAEQNAAALRENLFIRLAVGELDETYQDNLQFHEYLTQLNIPHDFFAKPGVPHHPLQLFNSLADANWDFYQQVFGLTI